MKEVSVMIVKIKRYCSIVNKDHSTRYTAIVTYSAGAKISDFLPVFGQNRIPIRYSVQH